MLVAYVCIIATAAIAYCNLPDSFAFDDNFAITGNADVTGPYSSALWSHDFWGNSLQRDDSHKSYRPLAVLSFRLSKTLWYSNEEISNGSWQNHAFPFHAENLALHMMVSVLTFDVAIASSFLAAGTKRLAAAKQRQVALAAALLFAAHPANSEAVLSAVGRSDLLSAALGLLGFTIFWRTCAATLRRVDFGSLLKLALATSVMLVGAAILCKETAFMLFVVMAAYTLLCLTSDVRKHSMRPHSVSAWIRGGSIVIVLMAVSAAYIVFRHWITGAGLSVGAQVFRKTENPMAFEPSFVDRALSKAHVHAIYFGKLLWPQNLSVDYSMDCIPLIHAWKDWRNARAFTLYFCGTCCAVAIVPWSAMLFNSPCHRKVQRVESSTAESSKVSKASASAAWKFAPTFGLVWIFATALPLSNVVSNIGTCVAERLLYLPNVGACYVGALAIHHICWRVHRRGWPWSSRSTYWCIVTAILSVFIIRTRIRSLDWASEETLFTAAYQVCPNSVKVLQNFGTLHRRVGNFTGALHLYRRTQEIDPDFCDSNFWIAMTEHDLGHIEEAWNYAIRGMDCKFNLVQSAQLLQALYSAYYESRPVQFSDQTAAFGEVVALNIRSQALEGFVMVRNLASNVYSQTRDARRALGYMEKARELAIKAKAQRPPGFPDEALCSMYVSLAVYRVEAHDLRTTVDEEVSISGLDMATQKLILEDLMTAAKMPPTVTAKSPSAGLSEVSCSGHALSYLARLLTVSGVFCVYKSARNPNTNCNFEYVFNSPWCTRVHVPMCLMKFVSSQTTCTPAGLLFKDESAAPTLLWKPAILLTIYGELPIS